MSRVQVSVIAFAVALAIGGGAFYLGRSTSGQGSNPAVATAIAASSGERKVLYWHDPMVPGQRFDKPGKSPFMDMPLQPVYADAANAAGVKVSPQVQQNLGIRTATVKRAEVAASFDARGHGAVRRAPDRRRPDARRQATWSVSRFALPWSVSPRARSLAHRLRSGVAGPVERDRWR